MPTVPPENVPISGNLPPLQRGQVFSLEFEVTDPPGFDFAGRDVELILDSPKTKRRERMEDLDGAMVKSGSKVTVEAGEDWSADLPEDGVYQVCFKVDGSVFAYYLMKVWSMPAGPTGPGV